MAASCGSVGTSTRLYLWWGFVVSPLSVRRKGQAPGAQTPQIPGGVEKAEMVWRPREAPRAGLASAFFPRKPPSLPNVLPERASRGRMTRGRGGSRFRVSPAQRAEPGFLSIEVGGLVQPKLCTQERPSSRRQLHTPVSSAAPPPAAAFPQSQVQQLCGRGAVPTLQGLVRNGSHREFRTLGSVTQQ